MWVNTFLSFQDPREALILTLKREVGVLQSENEHLRSALHVYSGTPNGDALAGKLYLFRHIGECSVFLRLLIYSI